MAEFMRKGARGHIAGGQRNVAAYEAVCGLSAGCKNRTIDGKASGVIPYVQMVSALRSALFTIKVCDGHMPELNLQRVQSVAIGRLPHVLDRLFRAR